MLKALIKLLIFLKPRGNGTVEDIKCFHTRLYFYRSLGILGPYFDRTIYIVLQFEMDRQKKKLK